MELEMPKTELKMASHENSYEVEEDSIISSVKEEPLVFVDEEQEHLPKAMEGLKETGAAPFLKKTYEMIDDPNTDDIISWTSSTTSFVVWDPHKFSTHLLPNHFKHNNFSSFVRQLNTYRFRKIHPDRWEFANIGFQKGKKHLLKHIKRRKHSSQNMHQSNPRVDEEFEKLKTEQDILQAEILKLRQQQDNTQHYLAAVEERLRIAETKQKHMVIFMIKSLKNPLFLEHLIEKMKKKKKRRLAFIDDEVQEELAMVQSEIQTLFSSDDEHNSSDENFVLWEKLMEDDMIYEAGREQYDIVLELEDLIAKPT